MIVTMLGKRWRLQFCRLEDQDVDGTCDAPTTPNKQICIDDRLSGVDQLETIIHECRHAADWHRSEEAITDEAHDLAAILWRLGYRMNTTTKKDVNE